MSLKIGDTAPDFEADTTEGRIRFHHWFGDSWAVLFSHPKDFTPVCTTELGYLAKIKEEFERRNVKIIGLSIDSTGDHEAWARDIEETEGAAPVNGRRGGDVTSAGSATNDDAGEILGDWQDPKPYIRIVPAPHESVPA